MVAPPTPRRVTLGVAVAEYLDACAARRLVGDLSPRTVEAYTADLHAFTQILGEDTVVDDITGSMVDKAITAFGGGDDLRYRDPAAKGAPGRGVGAQARFRRTVGRFFDHAATEAWVQVSPMAWSVLKPRSRGGLRTARTSLTVEQAGALLRHGAGEPGGGGRSHEQNHARDRLVLAMLVILGPRVSEIIAADTVDFFTDDGVEYWRITGKGGKVRKVPLSGHLSALKAEYLAVRPSPGEAITGAARASAQRALLRTGRGGRMAARDVQRLLVRARDRVAVAAPGLERDVTPHALRHTAATVMLSAGWDVKVVSRMLGHASLATTGLYLDDLPGELALAVAQHPLGGASTPAA